MPAKLQESDFWVRVAEKNDAGCMEWLKSLHADGYGHLTYHRKYWLAHRLAWTLTNGPIPEGLGVLHKCDNPKCCNPEHLFVGTHAENMADMRLKGRRRDINACEENGRAKLNKDQVGEIRRAYREGLVTQQKLADSYGVSQSVISLLLRGVTWKEPAPPQTCASAACAD